MIRDWVPARAWPLADALGAITGRTRFRPVASWAAACARTRGYEAAVDEQPPTGDEWDSQWPAATSREVQLVAAIGVVLNLLAKSESLRVLDFGGWSGQYSVGASRAFPGIRMDWTVVETPAAVRHFQEVEAPAWISWTTELREGANYDLVLASASLNYVADPISTLNHLATLAPFIILTRLPLWPIPRHQPAVQVVDRRRRTSYPTWFFAEDRFREQLDAIGEIALEWPVAEDTAYFEHHRCDYRGLVLRSSVYTEPPA